MSVAHSPLGSVDHKALFAPNIIIEFAEDSPTFRRKVEELDKNVEGEWRAVLALGLSCLWV